jgi:formylglycine-generating enzyme required for sulfatase activity
MTIVYVPGGTFMMGSDDGQHDEKPPHQVTLDAFWLDQTEVTNAQYNRCVEAGDCAASRVYDGFTGDDYPVVGVTWDDANTYCQWAGGRLPTEAEWEYAARGPEGNKYPWGNDPPTCELAQFSGCQGDTIPAGSLSEGASWVGAQDMAGNVWEWVADSYDSGYYQHSPEMNPTGPENGSYKVVRGGAWYYNESYVRSAYRSRNLQDLRASVGGFRCVVPPGN